MQKRIQDCAVWGASGSPALSTLKEYGGLLESTHKAWGITEVSRIPLRERMRGVVHFADFLGGGGGGISSGAIGKGTRGIVQLVKCFSWGGVVGR